MKPKIKKPNDVITTDITALADFASKQAVIKTDWLDLKDLKRLNAWLTKVIRYLEHGK